MATRPLSERAIDELLQQAAKYETMAASATTLAVAEGLLRLAVRFCELARQRAGAPVQQPGESAAETGVYRQLNIFGAKTGITVDVRRGEALPAAPRGCTWCLADDSTVA
jgi:hypothetical protein